VRIPASVALFSIDEILCWSLLRWVQTVGGDVSGSGCVHFIAVFTAHLSRTERTPFSVPKAPSLGHACAGDTNTSADLVLAHLVAICRGHAPRDGVRLGLDPARDLFCAVGRCRDGYWNEYESGNRHSSHGG